jgi:Uma2 family endonuclease
MAHPDIPYERMADGEIVIAPPAGWESENRNARVVGQLLAWADRDGRGSVVGQNAQFFLPDVSALSPDAAWISNESLSRTSPKECKRFPYLVPEFVVEILSPSDRLSRAKTKMDQWIGNGVQLGWLIDGDAQTVCIYEPGKPVEARPGILKLSGAGPVDRFVLRLRDIWAGLR